MSLPESRSEVIPRQLTAQAMAAHLRTGEAALLPTDTVPALAVVPDQAARIWQRKQRPAEKPLILMGADLEQLQSWLAVPWQPGWLEAARLHWPGAVTLVLPIEGRLTERLHPGGDSLGLRVPACPRLQELLRLSGPLATSSANRSGLPAARSAAEAAAQFPELPLLAPLPWPPCSGQASAVWRWHADAAAAEPGGSPWRVLRPGAVSPPVAAGPAAAQPAAAEPAGD